MSVGRSHFTRGAAAAAILSFAFGVHAQDLPRTMTWTSYGVGSAGYAEASAIADALGKEYGTRIRIQTSGSAIGRLVPIVRGRAGYGFLATEAFFASEGIQNFATRRWGPQNLRALAGRPSSFGMATTADSGIETVADVAGHRVAYIAGNPSVNIKCDAILAFGGLSREDVEVVKFPTYGAAMNAPGQGKADATCTTASSGEMYELASTPSGIHWIDMPDDNDQGWQRVHQVIPFLAPFKETVGAGISEDNPVEILAYRYPMLVTTAEASADEVYALTKALDETFGLYKDATAAMPRWKLGVAGTPPMDVPFHEGAIRYLKEQGIWDEEAQAWNEARIARLDALRSAWKETVTEGEDLSDKAFARLWEKRRKKALARLQ